MRSSVSKRRPSAALVISVIALIIAVGGGTFAFAALNRRSVRKIATNVFNSKIGGATAGTANQLAGVSYRSSAAVPVAAGTAGQVSAICPSGQVAIGGGGRTGNYGVELGDSRPASTSGATPNSWLVIGDNLTGSASTVEAFVVCTRAASTDNPSALRGTQR